MESREALENHKGLQELCKKVHPPEDILRGRAEIAKRLIAQSANISGNRLEKISPMDLKLLFVLYDEIFFNSVFQREFKGKLKFSLSHRLTKSAGKTICPKNIATLKPEEVVLEVRMGTGFFLDFEEAGGTKAVGGIKASDGLEAFLLVLEHELCHVLEFINFHNSSCRRNRFKVLAGNLFGHTESCHRLPTAKEVAREKYGLKIGDAVTFYYENKKIKGILHNINKRATVMVKDGGGAYRDRYGTRYSKYYVPLSGLM